MSLLDKDPYNPIVRAAMSRMELGEIVAIVRETRALATMKYFTVVADPQWGKRLVPYEGVPSGKFEIIRI